MQPERDSSSSIALLTFSKTSAPIQLLSPYPEKPSPRATVLPHMASLLPAVNLVLLLLKSVLHKWRILVGPITLSSTCVYFLVSFFFGALSWKTQFGDFRPLHVDWNIFNPSHSGNKRFNSGRNLSWGPRELRESVLKANTVFPLSWYPYSCVQDCKDSASQKGSYCIHVLWPFFSQCRILCTALDL